ncbi:aspartate ammonia-lyase [Bacillus sp. HMF5848]|uniref:aspartate ammonia-lyase n=1 Tax=Bacillus sp. HMF5848 TaxID=2495421 RepID=UPI000F7776AA|nr:aspartate ammonia-lyase [Bacillus sp. HMF5848]RSK25705.1 aspartate ammonia-lyase [Bacillus sp. HMF5848]
MEYRIERDSLGEKEIPINAYYGIHSLRALENFPITGVPVHKELLDALAEVKKAAALANMDTKLLPKPIGHAIVKAAEEVIDGNFSDQFITDSIQGGAGTSINMNMNEVLANRALEIQGYEKGHYFHCSPTNHVNMSQSTNDTIPTSLRIAAYKLTRDLLDDLAVLKDGFQQKEQEFNDVIKMGRTHLQDAVPIRLGQEFGAYARVLERDIRRITQASQELLHVNMGATAVGTGLNALPLYIEKVAEYLSKQVGIPLQVADDLVDATQNTDAYTHLSGSIKVLATNLSKIANDLRLMASGPFTGLNEINLPPRQAGSSIMPGKVNPVMVEVMNQTCFQVHGNDHTIHLACEAGQFELNVMGPTIIFNLLQSLKIMRNSIDVFYKYAIKGITVNRKICKEYVEKSFGIITALNPHIGYNMAASLVKDSMTSGLTIKEVILERQLLTEEQLDAILDPNEMTSPGIAGERYMNTD